MGVFDPTVPTNNVPGSLGSNVAGPPVPAVQQANTQAQTTANYLGPSVGLIDQNALNQQNQLNSQMAFANQALGLNAGYTTNEYNLQSQNLTNTLSSQLYSNLLNQMQLELSRQGVTNSKQTAFRNFDWTKQQLQNSAAARGAYGMPGWGQQAGQANQQLIDILKDLGLRWQGMDIQSAGLTHGASDIRQQNLIQQAMMKLSKDYQLQSGQLGFNQQVANAGFQGSQNIINAGQQYQNLMGTIFGTTGNFTGSG